MFTKIPQAFPVCATNRCLSAHNDTEFKVIDITGRAEVVDAAQDIPHPYLTVRNSAGTNIGFVAIDKCIFGDSDEKKCDCAVFDTSKICFVEIKKASRAAGRGKKRDEASGQLLRTIREFRACIDFSELNVEAILCVGHKRARPAASASSSDKKALFAQAPVNAVLLDGNEITFP